MALAKAKKDAGAASEQSFNIEVKRAHELDNGTIMFDMVVNGVTIYGCNYKVLTRKDNGEEFAKIGFPSRKGSDGKYYNQAYFKITDDLVKVIEAGIDSVL